MENATSGTKRIDNYIPVGYRPVEGSVYCGDTLMGDGKNQAYSLETDGRLLTFPVNTGTTYMSGTAVYVTT